MIVSTPWPQPAVCPDSMQNSAPSTIIPVSTSEMDNGHAQIYTYMYNLCRHYIIINEQKDTEDYDIEDYDIDSHTLIQTNNWTKYFIDQCMSHVMVRWSWWIIEWVSDSENDSDTESVSDWHFHYFHLQVQASLTLCVCVSGGYIFILLAVRLMSQFFLQ